MNPKFLKVILAFFLFINITVIAQVGIGIATPDPSSILDLTSTTQGVLTPRMTSAQRIAISNPTEGLLVFDTEEDAFYYFNGGSWIKLEGSETRINYKLVKSVADLTDELAAGGGTKYLLNSTYLYEINGTIVVNFPIDLNEAYIRGQDTRGDILFNNSGTALFSGSKGGNIRDLLVAGNGLPAFNISATAAENIIVNSVVFTGCSTVGDLTNLGLVFFNISQFISCNNGLNVANINSFLVANIFWTSSSVGTFLNLAGTFDDIQLSSGRVSVDAGEIGIDVSSNPIINNTGSINGITFTGSGSRVSGYTVGNFPGYYFSKEWDVNSPGLLAETDNNATGTIYVSSSVLTPIPGANTPVKALGTTTPVDLFRFDTNSANNRLQYTGTKTKIFNITASLSITSTNSNQVLSVYIAKNGAVINSTRIRRKIGTGSDIGAMGISGTVQLSTGDYIELWVANDLSGRDSTIENMNLRVN